MPKLDKRLTDTVARAIPLPEPRGIKTTEVIRGKAATVEKSVQVFYWCKDTTGFGLRVSSNGDRSYVSERRVDGKTVRRTLGKASGAGAISSEAARKKQIEISSELQTGVDAAKEKRIQRKQEKHESVTLADAISEYVEGKRRGNGLGLKDRTKADYLAMVGQGGQKANGEPFANGPLFVIADKPIGKITGDDMKRAYKAAAAKSQRTATYAMQVLRAVLNWHGITIENSPLAKGTAGKDRIILAPTVGKPTPIPRDRLGAWWRAASSRSGAAADGCRFILLTGCRPGEILGSEYETGLLVGNVDLRGGRLTLIDTKNRKDHTVILSTHAREIVAAHCKGKKPDAKVFDILDPGKTLDAINAEAGVVGITPHKLRHTFASIAAAKCNGYEIKAMLNHSAGGDVTAEHYVDVEDSDLGQAWQKVADFIVAQ